MGHTAVSATETPSVTLQIWQHEAKYINCYFATFNSVVDTKTIFIQMGPNKWIQRLILSEWGQIKVRI